jgi:hypothetical protein
MLLEWVAKGIAYGVSAHGHTAVNRKLVLFIANHLQPVVVPPR